MEKKRVWAAWAVNRHFFQSLNTRSQCNLFPVTISTCYLPFPSAQHRLRVATGPG